MYLPFFNMDTLSSENGSVTCIVCDTDMYKLNKMDNLLFKFGFFGLSIRLSVYHVGECFSSHPLYVAISNILKLS